MNKSTTSRTRSLKEEAQLTKKEASQLTEQLISIVEPRLAEHEAS
jgi:hypothetical protein